MTGPLTTSQAPRTETQMKLARELLGQLVAFDKAQADRLTDWMGRHEQAGTFTKERASKLIAGLIDVVKEHKRTAKPAPLPVIPDGRYAITGRDGSTDFYRVTRKNKTNELRLFLYVSDDQRPVTSARTIESVFRRIAADGIEAANLRWALEMVRCRKCGAQLTDDQNNPFRELGFGPECGKA